MAILEIFPKSIALFPNDRKLFTARATPAPPMWEVLLNGLVQSDYSMPIANKSQACAAVVAPLRGAGAHQLMGGIGAIEFTIDATRLHRRRAERDD
jgi:hypothetical protein